jgi:putative ABC transport system substrate-binding protein
MAAGVEGATEPKTERIGMLETVAPLENVANFDAFRRRLGELGYMEGQDLAIEYRSADGRAERFPALANELVQLPVDIIVTRGTPAALAAKQATATIPVVMAAIGEPLGSVLLRVSRIRAEMSPVSALS